MDVGLTHVALPARDLDASVAFYAKYARMEVVHRRSDPSGADVVWLSDRTRPFVIVLIRQKEVRQTLGPLSHLGVGCATREEVDRLCAEARADGALRLGPVDSSYPVGYWAFLADPDGHTLELSHGQEVGLAVERAGGAASGTQAGG
ncbi:MAG TPA: VOC family protein [Myxococcota bacterium]|jgi:catechol 2,3-dioxygenase-like lactoylglutathione lyase family enzyme|nr:VOC family protein [Myxococcota bacterium]